MLLARTIVRPDSRPLYKYRFTEREYSRAVEMLKSNGRAALRETEGCALFVMVLAEWFRRSREGGSWGWDAPLSHLNLQRDEHRSGVRLLRYSELIEAVLRGLEWWGRPAPEDLDGLRYVYAVVRESGLPLCEVRRATWLRAWIIGAVRRLYAGEPLERAVEEERRRRATSEQLSEVIFEVVCELVQSVFNFKRQISAGDGVLDEDPVLRLSRIRPDWMDELPVPAEAEDMRALIAEVLRTPAGDADVFSAERLLERRGGEWRPALSLGLEGELEVGTVAPELRAAMQDASRAQIFLRTSSGRASSRAIGLIERTFSGDSETFGVRALGRRRFELGLEEDVTLVCQVAERTPVLITPRGASAQTEPVMAFAAAGENTDELRLVSNGSADHPGDTLHLLIHSSALEEIVWTNATGRGEPVPVGDDHVLIALSGEARWERDNLARVWRTGCDTASGSPLLLDGPMTMKLRPFARLGFPRVLTRDKGALVEAPKRELMWRPKGRGAWRPLADHRPLGDVEIGWVRDGVLAGTVREHILPEDFEVDFAPAGGERRATLSGLDGASVDTSGDGLTVHDSGAETVIRLSDLAAGAAFTLKLAWADGRSCRLKLRDNSLSHVILKEDRPAERGASTGAATLFQYTAWTRRSDLLMFELAGQGRGAGFVRAVSGETLLTVYRDDIRALLSQSTDHEARVDISWRGGGRALRVTRYEVSLPRDLWRRATDEARTFLESQGVASLIFIPLLAPEKAAEVTLDETMAELSYQALAENLSAPGPWIVTGRTAGRGRFRPVFLETSARATPADALEQALLSHHRRTDGLIEAASQSPAAGRRFAEHALATVRAARRFQAPMMSFDSLTVLAEAPGLAITVLAAAGGRSDLDAILDLETEMALVWPATSAQDWEAAFNAQFDSTHRALKAAGLPDPGLAARPLISHLEQIALRSDLRLHAARAAHGVMSRSGMDADARRVAEAPFKDAIGQTQARPYFDLAQSMIKRRVEGVARPRLGLQAAVPAELKGRFPSDFDCVLAAPSIAGAMATGERRFDPSIVAKLRLARLFDPEFFDAAASRAALDQLQKTPA
ncbi:MAG: STY4851/ECs_5259 family protein [Oceanicaulis sp.]